ncbi:MAG TPA: hypothetical protein VFP05_12100 [Thermomicrobiales bacterium]|nr:hypothetical protein [Thermomicrobiales bacterium]
MRLLGQPRRALPFITAGLVLTLGLILGSGQATAHETTTAPHPAHIHSGSCTELGDVVYPLTDVSPGAAEMTGTPVTGEMTGSPESGSMSSTSHQMEGMGSPTSEMAMGTAEPEASPAEPFGVIVETSETTVEAALADLSAGGYAINVHESAENIGNYIACGDIAGAANDNGDLTIKLDTLNDSGYMGTAVLHDNGDSTTTVSITLTHAES